MLIYIASVEKPNPLGDTIQVKARMYQAAPVAASPAGQPGAPTATGQQYNEFQFTTQAADIKLWNDRVGKFADLSNLSYA